MVRHQTTRESPASNDRRLPRFRLLPRKKLSYLLGKVLCGWRIVIPHHHDRVASVPEYLQIRIDAWSAAPVTAHAVT